MSAEPPSASQGPPAYPNYPPPGQPPGPTSWPPPGQPPGSPRQHAWRTPAAPPPPPPPPPPATNGRRPGSAQRSLIWLIVIVAIIVILVRAHRIDSTEIILFCVLVPSVIIHEISHGLVALAFGDDTAKRAGRLSLNPLRHVTLFGTIIVPAITIWAGWGYFGWAKPVPVNVRKLRRPRDEGVLVALAGPFTNVVLAVVFGVIFYLAFALGRSGPVPTTLAARIVFWASFINLWVACFNMIPIPPLDGSALLERLLPSRLWPAYLRWRPFGMVIILGGLVLMSLARVYPLQFVVNHIATWWAHVVHAD